MADFAGAVAALRTAFAAAWTETPIAYQNEDPPQQPWPPATPWVYFEVEASASDLRGAGSLGDHVWLTTGHIFARIFCPLGYGYPESLRLAEEAGNIFRAQTFYQDGAGAKVLCGAPLPEGGDSNADQGDWFLITAAVPFEFFFRK